MNSVRVYVYSRIQPIHEKYTCNFEYVSAGKVSNDAKKTEQNLLGKRVAVNEELWIDLNRISFDKRTAQTVCSSNDCVLIFVVCLFLVHVDCVLTNFAPFMDTCIYCSITDYGSMI